MNFKNQNGLELRPMTLSDIPRALDIINDYDEDDALEARETYENSVEHQFCLCERGQVIGVVGAKPIENTIGSFGLSWTYLQRADRRSGKGSQMLDWILDVMRGQSGRKAFVSTSDYQDPDEGDIYFDAREAYKRAGFIQEIRQPDYYSPGESMLVYGLRLQPRQPVEPILQTDHLKITDVDEIPETNHAYWIAWEVVPPGQGTTSNDFERVVREVQSWGGRSIYMAVPSDLEQAGSLLTASRFRISGRLMDYYEDGVDELHYRYDLYR
jgi:N-acetylglutamate synthase-like GNAT family acetyltransferase